MIENDTAVRRLSFLSYIYFLWWCKCFYIIISMLSISVRNIIHKFITKLYCMLSKRSITSISTKCQVEYARTKLEIWVKVWFPPLMEIRKMDLNYWKNSLNFGIWLKILKKCRNTEKPMFLPLLDFLHFAWWASKVFVSLPSGGWNKSKWKPSKKY